MRLYRCDRCHKEVPAGPPAAVTDGITPVSIGAISVPGTGTDLCDQCVRALKAWLRDPPPTAAAS